jgi:thioredoxin 1
MRIDNRFNQIIRAKRPVLVYFHAEWCIPCHQLLPVLKSVKNTFRKNIRIIKVNVDHNPSIASMCRIKKLPTLILFRAGTMEWMNEGMLDASSLADILTNFVRNEKQDE